MGEAGQTRENNTKSYPTPKSNTVVLDKKFIYMSCDGRHTLSTIPQADENDSSAPLKLKKEKKDKNQGNNNALEREMMMTATGQLREPSIKK